MSVFFLNYSKCNILKFFQVSFCGAFFFLYKWFQYICIYMYSVLVFSFKWIWDDIYTFMIFFFWWCTWLCLWNSTLRVKQVNLTYFFSKLIILHRKFTFLSIDEVARLLFYMCFDNKSKLSLSFFSCFFFNHLALS